MRSRSSLSRRHLERTLQRHNSRTGFHWLENLYIVVLIVCIFAASLSSTKSTSNCEEKEKEYVRNVAWTGGADVRRCFSKDVSSNLHAIHPVRFMTHYVEVLKNTRPFRGFEHHSHGGYSGPWIENLWIEKFMNKEPETFGPFVPLFIQWVDAIHHVTYEEIASVLQKTLRRDVMYVTVSQADFGLSQGEKVDLMKRFPNILVLSAGGYGHVPIPLLKNEARRDVACKHHEAECESAPYQVSFVGQHHFGRDRILDSVLESLGEEHVKTYRGDDWDRVVASSQFCLTPRGYGRTSFMMYESIQLGTIPIYVYDDRAWLPYRDLPWDELSVVISKENLNQLPSVLKYADVRKMRENLENLRDSHFTFDGVLDQIAKFMRGGERDSDLRCETNIPLYPGLAKFDSMSSLFSTADKNMDSTLSLSETKAVLTTLVLKTPDGNSVKIPPHEHEAIFSALDKNQDGTVSKEEWRSGGRVLRAAILRLA